MLRFLIAFWTTATSILPSRAKALSVATMTKRQSTSKKSRNAARFSLRPKPSVPSDTSGRGSQRSIASGSAFT
jgi:hypothetical protein